MTILPVQTVRQLILNAFPLDISNGNQVGETTPAKFDGRLPFVKVRHIGGSRDFKIHRPRIVISVFGAYDKTSATQRGAAEDLAARIDDYLTYKTPVLVGNVVIGLSGTTQPPSWTPYDDENVTQYVATYRFSMHEDRTLVS